MTHQFTCSIKAHNPVMKQVWSKVGMGEGRERLSLGGGEDGFNH